MTLYLLSPIDVTIDRPVTATVGWFERNIAEPGKLPLLLCFGAFVITFFITRTITLRIREGRGRLKDNVSKSGLHIHHAVPGVLLLILGGILAVGAPPEAPWREIAGAMVGVGAALVLDEFALILRLQDVYWSSQGRLSVEMVSVASAVMGFMLVGTAPWGIDAIHADEFVTRMILFGAALINLVCIVFAVLKGKHRGALVGVFIPMVSLFLAIRLARPGSRWSRRYSPAKLDKATERAKRFDARFAPIAKRFEPLVTGVPEKVEEQEQRAGDPPST